MCVAFLVLTDTVYLMHMRDIIIMCMHVMLKIVSNQPINSKLNSIPHYSSKQNTIIVHDKITNFSHDSPYFQSSAVNFSSPFTVLLSGVLVPANNKGVV